VETADLVTAFGRLTPAVVAGSPPARVGAVFSGVLSEDGGTVVFGCGVIVLVMLLAVGW
jgi:hypothetical protein